MATWIQGCRNSRGITACKWTSRRADDAIMTVPSIRHSGEGFILDKMLEAISASRSNTSRYAPRIYSLKISTDNPRRHRTRGKVIRSIISRLASRSTLRRQQGERSFGRRSLG
jgi:polyribonucleotide nucleotidyltransferase